MDKLKQAKTLFKRLIKDEKAYFMWWIESLNCFQTKLENHRTKKIKFFINLFIFRR